VEEVGGSCANLVCLTSVVRDINNFDRRLQSFELVDGTDFFHELKKGETHVDIHQRKAQDSRN
jgi:hypothetical protein